MILKVLIGLDLGCNALQVGGAKSSLPNVSLKLSIMSIECMRLFSALYELEK
jgi:hypothetical protein